MNLMLIVAGLLHFTLVPVSLAVPVVLGWRREFAPLSPFTRRIVWVHGGYITATVIALGVLTLVGRGEILAGAPLGRAFAAFVALFWGARLVIQLFFYPKEEWPKGRWVVWGRRALTLLFACWAGAYGLVALK